MMNFQGIEGFESGGVPELTLVANADFEGGVLHNDCKQGLALSVHSFMERGRLGRDEIELVALEPEVEISHGRSNVLSQQNGGGRRLRGKSGSRYIAEGVNVAVEFQTFFGRRVICDTSLQDFSLSEISLLCKENLHINKCVQLSLVFSDGSCFELEGIVSRSDIASFSGDGFLVKVLLGNTSQCFKDYILQEGLRRRFG